MHRGEKFVLHNNESSAILFDKLNGISDHLKNDKDSLP